MTASPYSSASPTPLPAPTGMGDWLDSSIDLLRGMLVQELPVLWWEDIAPASLAACGPWPQTAH